MNLMRVKSTVKWQIKRLIGRAQPIDQQHPWHPLAVLVCGNTGTAAKHQVNHWIGNGFATNELARLQNLPTAAPSAEACCPSWHAPGDRAVEQFEADHWGHHAWLDHCPVVADQLSITGMSDPNAAPVALNPWDPQPGMECCANPAGLSGTRASLGSLQGACPTLAPLGDPRFVAKAQSDWQWLPAVSTDRFHPRLPEPQALQSIGCSVLCLGNINPTLNKASNLHCLASQTRCPDSWHQHAPDRAVVASLPGGKAIDRAFSGLTLEEKCQTWEALVKSHHPAPSVLFPKSPLGVETSSMNSLAPTEASEPNAMCHTTPETRCIFSHETRRPEVAVCVSLYNYANTITSALNSAATQSNVDQLELIVVDDGSTDESRAAAEQWLKTNGQRFARCLLLEHTQNGGLAAARNTAFEAAKSSWCFVLDADNQLHTKAASHCGALSKSVDPRCGVIYPLIKILNEPGSQDPRHLVSDRLWDQTLLAQGNYIDAMALVRVDAWREVGDTPTFPEAGRTDDFWCKLLMLNGMSALPSGISHLHESHGLYACNKHQQKGAAVTQTATTTPSVVEAHHSAGCCVWPPTK